MKNILTLALLAGFGVAVICALLALRSQPTKLDPPVPLVQSPSAEKAPASRVIPADPAPPVTFAPRATGLAATPVRFPEVQPATTTNKLERLNQIREDFRKLAAGDPAAAMRAAKEIKDGTERETALLTLVTEWRQGDLGPPARRARMIAAFGLEAGMAIEIVSDPKLAVLWANELTDGVGRSIVLQQAASTLLATDPAAALP